MPGFVPGIHVFPDFIQSDVDGRDKPGHDALYDRRRVLADRARVLDSDKTLKPATENFHAHRQPRRRSATRYPGLAPGYPSTSRTAVRRAPHCGIRGGPVAGIRLRRGRPPVSAAPASSASSRAASRAGKGDIKVIGLRADMDALPIEEATNLALRLQDAGQDARLRP